MAGAAALTKAAIRKREREGFAPPPRLTPGMRVRILQGPFHSQIGMLAALRSHERMHVLLQMLGGERRVELAQESIGAVE
jgi:hypothetical protein